MLTPYKVKRFFNFIMIRIFILVMATLTFVPKYKYGRFIGLQYRLRLLLKRQKLEKAEILANELLEIAQFYKDDWNYCNAIHKGHLALGRIAFTRGDYKKAEEELLASVEIEGSPQISSFGPNMSLAKDFLLKGDSKITLKYLENCRRCWKYGSDYIDCWMHQIRTGHIPDFGGNLYY